MSPKVGDRRGFGSKISMGSESKLPFPKIDFKVDAEFPIRILDNMIQVEEEMAGGFSVYNRGQNLKKSLIDPARVKEYLKKMNKPK